MARNGERSAVVRNATPNTNPRVATGFARYVALLAIGISSVASTFARSPTAQHRHFSSRKRLRIYGRASLPSGCSLDANSVWPVEVVARARAAAHALCCCTEMRTQPPEFSAFRKELAKSSSLYQKLIRFSGSGVSQPSLTNTTKYQVSFCSRLAIHFLPLRVTTSSFTRESSLQTFDSTRPSEVSAFTFLSTVGPVPKERL